MEMPNLLLLSLFGLEFVYSKYGIINQNSVYCLIVFNFYNYYYYYFFVFILIFCAMIMLFGKKHSSSNLKTSMISILRTKKKFRNLN